ncbi:IS3 family transposase [Alteromonas sp. chi3]|uniref:IS3 family transposase n=1 Tax=Alteromonas gilva TaxID=2987522 RepID=A0ABT5KXQ0_9ALTE|nr:IS3 family transposase [Alteromonas gilva]MDC8829548.1 IS3 family transposase [Alteromonas gilva]
MCQILNIERSGCYAWLQQQLSARAKEDQRLLGKINQFWLERGCTYGYPNTTIEFKSDGETCGKNHVHRLMREASIRAERAYKRHQCFKGRKVSMVGPNTLKRELILHKPDSYWVTDFTSIRNYEGGYILLWLSTYFAACYRLVNEEQSKS